MILNGDAERRYPGNLNLSFAFVEGESLLMVCWPLSISPCRTSSTLLMMVLTCETASGSIRPLE